MTDLCAKGSKPDYPAQAPIIDLDLALTDLTMERVQRWVNAGDAFVQALFERHELQQQQVDDLLDMIDTFEPKEDDHV